MAQKWNDLSAKEVYQNIEFLICGVLALANIDRRFNCQCQIHFPKLLTEDNFYHFLAIFVIGFTISV